MPPPTPTSPTAPQDNSLAVQNNNPGDLREAGQTGSTPGKGGFAAFATPQAGMGALLNQIQTNINNKPSESLADFSSNYAPASDGNDVAQYTANLANQLGVSPLTPISQLSSEVPQFAQAVAHNEDDDTPAANATGAKTKSPSIGTDIAGIAGGATAAAIPAAGSIAGSAAPDIGEGIGTVAGGALGTLVGPEGTVGGAVVGGLLGNEAGQVVKGFLGGSPSSSNTAVSDGSNDTSSAPTPLETYPGEAQDTSALSGVGSAVNDALSNTVGGNNVMQEGANRGVDDIGGAMAQMGLVPQVDGNGNYDKLSPTLLANAGNSQDAAFLEEMAQQMPAQTSLQDLQDAALDAASSSMQGSPDLDSTLDKIRKTFQGHGRQHSNQTDKNGQQLSLSQQFVDAPMLLKMKQRAAEGENWATPHHERSASQHIKTTMGKRLSDLAKKNGIKGWDETNKRMETRFLIKKAIEALPKKAQRDFKKEMIRDLAGAAGGALIGKIFGQGLLGGAAGYVLKRQLREKQYKPLANKKQRGLLQKRAIQEPRNLMNGPNKEGDSRNK